MIYLTGDALPNALKLICPSCRVLLKADLVSLPADQYSAAYFFCRSERCTNFGVPKVRYNWPLPPSYFQDPSFWCQTERPSGAIADPQISADNSTQLSINQESEDFTQIDPLDQRTPEQILEETGVNPMSSKTPAVMQQLSAREKMLFSMYAKMRTDTPLSIAFNLPVGHEFLTPQKAGNGEVVPDSDPRLYRIDVVETYSDHIFIIEVKTHADLKAYGQLLAYIDLYKMHFNPTVPVVPLLVFEKASQILLGVCLQAEIPIVPVTIDAALGIPPTGKDFPQ